MFPCERIVREILPAARAKLAADEHGPGRLRSHNALRPEPDRAAAPGPRVRGPYSFRSGPRPAPPAAHRGSGPGPRARRVRPRAARRSRLARTALARAGAAAIHARLRLSGRARQARTGGACLSVFLLAPRPRAG